MIYYEKCRVPALPALLFLFAVLSLAGCGDNEASPGSVATVNGEVIFFQEVEARRISTFSPRTPEAEAPGEEELQRQYRYAVSRLVEERIICQFMKKKGFELDPAQLEEREARIREDYPDGGAFAGVFLEEGISQEIWRDGLRRQLTVEHFINSELRPEIAISSEEVEKYYRENIKDFVISEQWHFLQITGLDRREVENAQQDVMKNKNASAAQKEFLVSIHDISMARDLLPEDMQKALEQLEAWQGSEIVQYEDQFRSFVLLEKIPERQLDAATITARVERVLTEKKLKGIYAEWLNKNLSKNKISLAPALFRPVSQSAPGATPFPVLKTPSLPDPMLDFEPSANGAP